MFVIDDYLNVINISKLKLLKSRIITIFDLLLQLRYELIEMKIVLQFRC